MKKVVVFGSLPIASKIVEYLLSLKSVEVYVVIGNKPHNNDPWPDVPILEDYVSIHNITNYTLDDIGQNFEDKYFDLGLSCRYSRIIKPNIIKKFKYGILNLHGGLLPEFAGLYSVNHTILSGSKIGGGTIHYVDEGIDTGGIVRRCEVEINDDDTSYDLFQKTQIVLEKNLEEVIPNALEGHLPTMSHEELIKKGYSSAYFDKHSLDGKKEVKIEELHTLKATNIIRAFDFPGYEPAFFYDYKGCKVYLRYKI